MSNSGCLAPRGARLNQSLWQGDRTQIIQCRSFTLRLPTSSAFLRPGGNYVIVRFCQSVVLSIFVCVILPYCFLGADLERWKSCCICAVDPDMYDSGCNLPAFPGTMRPLCCVPCSLLSMCYLRFTCNRSTMSNAAGKQTLHILHTFFTSALCVAAEMRYFCMGWKAVRCNAFSSDMPFPQLFLFRTVASGKYHQFVLRLRIASGEATALARNPDHQRERNLMSSAGRRQPSSEMRVPHGRYLQTLVFDIALA